MGCKTRGASGDGLWGFGILVKFHRRARSSEACLDGGVAAHAAAQQAARLRLHADLLGEDQTRHECHDLPQRGFCGTDYRQAMPGHGARFRTRVVVGGGARGCCQRSKVSMTIMCPPQQGQGGRGSTGSSALCSSIGVATSSSLRARARLRAGLTNPDRALSGLST